tara:strand:- start:18442 stop:19269 length:828 start_codon:yes stop_codon:yes gene_type:complete
MSSNDADATLDFTLVRTYIPGLLLLLRFGLLCGVYIGLVCGLPLLHTRNLVDGVRLDIMVFTLTACGYLDSWFFKHDNLSKAAGFLAPVILALLTSSSSLYPDKGPCLDIPSVVLYYVSSIAWAASSSFCVLNMLLKVTSFDAHIAAVFWGIACMVLLYVDCHKKGLLELVVRGFLFYLLTILLWFSQTIQPDLERNRFTFSVMHSCLHVLFVDPYVVGASVFIWFCIFVYYLHTHVKNPISFKRHSTAKSRTPENDISLLRELEAAKRAGGLMP